MSKPLCRHCVAEVQLFMWCRNLSAGHCAAGVQLFKLCCNLTAGTVLHGCSCLSGVETYLPAVCCRGAAVKAVSQPICQHCVAEVQLFKWCRNLSAGTVLQSCSCLCGVVTYLPGTVLQRCSCLSSAKAYLPAVCCRGAAV